MIGEGKSGLELHEDYPAIIVVMSMLALFSIAGTIGNALVIYVYARKREKTTTTIFILTLAGTDFFTCLIIIPYTIIVEYVSKRIQYDTACKIYQFLITSNVPFSAFIMVVIAFDRYLKICRPWNHTLDVKMAKKTIAFLLLFAAVLGIITSLVHGVPNDGNKKVNETRTKSNSSFLSSNVNVNSLKDEWIWTTFPSGTDNNTLSSIMENKTFNKETNELIDHSKMKAVRRSKKSKKRLLNGGQNTSHQTVTTHTCAVTTKLTMAENGDVETVQMQQIPEKKSRQKRSKSLKEKHRVANIKTAVILFIVTVVFIIAFLPAWLMAMRAVGGNIILFYMHFSYNVANPIIYAFFNQNFRMEMKNVLNCS
ncbi:unnamed protein product [Mytilus coruscus]|uniref:G-protein coupled receptors family 1 profile domain-containing protein n=1 Tax=Mytilus coruscus TaxID=42192 RepID=A0A6J8BJ85_MYTCO|nr:unnamed protein product [Mytilus coruscus]